MTKIINGQTLNSWEEAVNAVFREANAPPFPLSIIKCFTFISKLGDESEFKDKAERFINKEFKVDFTYHQRELSWWYVPVPRVKYSRQDLPHLAFNIDLYIVATAEFHYWVMDYMKYEKTEAKYPCTLISKFIENIAKFDVPLVLLKAIADGDYSQYEVVEKERFWTTLDVNGFEAHLPDSFAQMVMGLHGKPLGKSLEAMKLVDAGVSALINKNLLVPLPIPEISAKSPEKLDGAHLTEAVVDKLTELGWTQDEASDAINSITFPATSTVEEIVKLILSQ